MKIAVFGDLIEDVFVYGSCERLNPEGPSPLITHKNTITKIGGAGNVVKSLKNLGLNPEFYHSNSLPSKKTRIIANEQIICRLDEDRISPNLQIDYNALNYDLVILSDYNKGALGDCRELIQRVQCNVFVDPKKEFINYRGAFCIKPNKLEFEKYFGSVTELNLKKFAVENNHELVIVTLGRDGVVYCYENVVYHLNATSNKVADVTGAGDCFLAGMVYGIVKGYDIHKAIELGNIGAGVSVRHPGTYTLNKCDLIKTKVFTNGCFDILHRGHIELLEKSKQLGDYLIVGLNSDRSVGELKGSNRPINSEQDRKKALESLKFVDEVIIFDESTPYELIKRVQPDVITKGGDYIADNVVGNDLAIVKIIPYVNGYSTTEILNK